MMLSNRFAIEATTVEERQSVILTCLRSVYSTHHVLVKALLACTLCLQGNLKLILEVVLTENYEAPSGLPGSDSEAV